MTGRKKLVQVGGAFLAQDVGQMKFWPMKKAWFGNCPIQALLEFHQKLQKWLQVSQLRKVLMKEQAAGRLRKRSHLVHSKDGGNVRIRRPRVLGLLVLLMLLVPRALAVRVLHQQFECCSWNNFWRYLHSPGWTILPSKWRQVHFIQVNQKFYGVYQHRPWHRPWHRYRPHHLQHQRQRRQQLPRADAGARARGPSAPPRCQRCRREAGEHGMAEEALKRSKMKQKKRDFWASWPRELCSESGHNSNHESEIVRWSTVYQSTNGSGLVHQISRQNSKAPTVTIDWLLLMPNTVPIWSWTSQIFPKRSKWNPSEISRIDCIHCYNIVRNHRLYYMSSKGGFTKKPPFARVIIQMMDHCQALVVHGWASPSCTPAPPQGFESAWQRFLPEMMDSYKETFGMWHPRYSERC